MYFGNCGLAKRWLDKYPKSAISQNLWTSNMLNVLKNISSHKGGTFIILIDHR